MTESTKSLLLVIGLVGFVGAALSILSAIYFLLSMSANVRPEKRLLVPFITPVELRFPQFWTEEGNRYRRSFFLGDRVWHLCLYTIDCQISRFLARFEPVLVILCL